MHGKGERSLTEKKLSRSGTVRRIRMEKQKQKGILSLLSGGIALLVRAVLVLALLVLSVYGFFRVRDIRVTGNDIYSADRIASESGIELGDQMGKAFLGNTRSRIREKLPAVENVKLRIGFPDTLVLEVRESKALLAARTERGTVCLTADGRVVAGYRLGGRLITLVGLNILEAEEGKTVVLGDGDAGKLGYLSELLTILDDRGILDKTEEIDISNIAALRFSYDNRLIVRIGGPDLLSNKLRFFEDILKELNNGETGTLDLTKNSEGHFIPG